MKSLRTMKFPQFIKEKQTIGIYQKIGEFPHALETTMNLNEMKFLNGLLYYYRPEKVLELGVAWGAGQAVIINAIRENPESTLVSIDLLVSLAYPQSELKKDGKVRGGGGGLPIGYIAQDLFPEFCSSRRKTHYGYDPSEVMEQYPEKSFDFAVIDTAHLHPIESLNFLCILPYLKDGAIVVMHDILCQSLPDMMIRQPGECYAPRVLYTALTADKLECETDIIPSNICAFQITADTRKYIENVFSGLYLPWEMYPARFESIRSLVEKHYDGRLLCKFDAAHRLYENYFKNIKNQVHLDMPYQPHIYIPELCFKFIPKDTIFYGAGVNLLEILHRFEKVDADFNFEIWDIKAENGDYKITSGNMAVMVTKPDFIQTVKNRFCVITIENEKLNFDVSSKLHKLGWTTISIYDFDAFLSLCPKLSYVKKQEYFHYVEELTRNRGDFYATR